MADKFKITRRQFIKNMLFTSLFLCLPCFAISKICSGKSNIENDPIHMIQLNMLLISA